jgi:hypothetical protein
MGVEELPAFISKSNEPVVGLGIPIASDLAPSKMPSSMMYAT